MTTVSRPLTFLRRGQRVTLDNVPPDRTLLEVLREDLHLGGTKEGCGEGDCGACTVVLAEVVQGKLQYKAVNSCIRLAHSVRGMAVFTAQDIGSAEQMHPCQEAMVQCHGSQCGFCTPGFVMSLFGMYQNSGGAKGEPVNISAEQAQADLSGNLCRCTGYRPILDAAQKMGSLPLPASCVVDEAATVAALLSLEAESAPQESGTYLRPTSLQELLEQRANFPQAQVVAGCTDVGLWVTKMHKRFERVIDVTGAQPLQQIERHPTHLAIGAAVSLTQAFDALVQDRPELQTFARRFAGLPVRNSGTLGGNVANGSPIGDSMPLLIALGASVVLMRWQKTAAGGQIAQREVKIEDLYTGYRTNVMQPDELLCWIHIPRPSAHTPSAHMVDGQAFVRAYKISKRFDDDISAVCLAIQITVQGGIVEHVRIGAGGVAATPARARQTEAALLGQSWTQETAHRAAAVLRTEFDPISDMRASADYRRSVLGNLLQRLWLESQGASHINLENFNTVESLV